MKQILLFLIMNIFGLHDCGPKIDDVHVHINMGEIQKGDVIENVMKTSPESDFQGAVGENRMITSHESDFPAAFTGCIRMNEDMYERTYKKVQDVRSKEACACKCQDEYSCKFFTWNEYSRVCHLKRYAYRTFRKGRYKDMKGSHSGYQGCCIKRPSCKDGHSKCKYWSKIIGECRKKWMLSWCQKSCKACADDPRWNMECYYSGVVKIFEDNILTLEADEFYTELKDEIVPTLLYFIKWWDLPRKIRRKKDKPKIHRFQDVKSLAKFSDEDHDDYYYDDELHDRLSDAFDKDTREIREILESGNEGKKKNFGINICPPIMKVMPPTPTAAIRPCEHYSWTAWGEWGACTHPCHKDGGRRRTRKCVNLCNDKEAEGKCKPFYNPHLNKNFTDTDFSNCLLWDIYCNTK